MGIGRVFEAAVLLLDDHREEALALQEIPDFLRHVATSVGDVEVVDHPAQFFAGSVDEALLFGSQHRRLGRQQLRPVRLAGEQLAVPPDGAGFEGFALGLRHRRQHFQVRPHEGAGDQRLADRADIEECERRKHQPEETLPEAGRCTERGVGHQQHEECGREGQQAEPPVGEVKHRNDEQQSDDAAGLGGSPHGGRQRGEDDQCTNHGDAAPKVTR